MGICLPRPSLRKLSRNLPVISQSSRTDVLSVRLALRKNDAIPDFRRSGLDDLRIPSCLEQMGKIASIPSNVMPRFRQYTTKSGVACFAGVFAWQRIEQIDNGDLHIGNSDEFNAAGNDTSKGRGTRLCTGFVDKSGANIGIHFSN